MQQVLLLTIEKLREGAVRGHGHDWIRSSSEQAGCSRSISSGAHAAVEALLEAFPAASHLVRFSAVAGRRCQLKWMPEERKAACPRLAERERTVVLLTFYGERPSRDIAQTLGTSEGNVRVIHSLAPSSAFAPAWARQNGRHDNTRAGGPDC